MGYGSIDPDFDSHDLHAGGVGISWLRVDRTTQSHYGPPLQSQNAVVYGKRAAKYFFKFRGKLRLCRHPDKIYPP